jgi:hypothetical protein
MKCEWPGCDREAEHSVTLRGGKAVNVCGAHRIEYLQHGFPKEKHHVQAAEASGQAGKAGKPPVVPAVPSDGA